MKEDTAVRICMCCPPNTIKGPGGPWESSTGFIWHGWRFYSHSFPWQLKRKVGTCVHFKVDLTNSSNSYTSSLWSSRFCLWTPFLLHLISWHFYFIPSPRPDAPVARDAQLLKPICLGPSLFISLYSTVSPLLRSLEPWQVYTSYLLPCTESIAHFIYLLSQENKVLHFLFVEVFLVSFVLANVPSTFAIP